MRTCTHLQPPCVHVHTRSAPAVYIANVRASEGGGGRGGGGIRRELGVRMIACEMSRDLMGIKESELVAGL